MANGKVFATNVQYRAFRYFTSSRSKQGGFLKLMNTKAQTHRPTPVMGGYLTTTPPKAAEGHLDPEFAGHAKIRELFDLSRTHLHRLSTEGLIRSVSLRQRGRVDSRAVRGWNSS